MSTPSRLRRGLAGTILAAAFAFAAVPAAVQAAPVNLATVSPFVVLGGTSVTNSGPSVLNGNLGVSPGTSLTGFGLPAVVNGATHENDEVAAQAQSDLTTAYTVAAEQPIAADLSGTDLGNRTLNPGAYRYSSSALLTGPLTLNAQGDPNAVFVFEIGSALTTESGSSVNLINGASPCNVYWQVGSSAELGTTTKFVGNLMALSSISLNNAVIVEGRMLARNGQVSLINDVLSAPLCATGGGSSPPPTGTGPGGTGGTGTGTSTTGFGKSPVPLLKRKRGTANLVRGPHQGCASGFRATVHGRMIKRVVFSLDGTKIASQTKSPFEVSVRAAAGHHMIGAQVTFKDATHAKNLRFAYRACAAASLRPRRGPSRFTG